MSGWRGRGGGEWAREGRSGTVEAGLEGAGPLARVRFLRDAFEAGRLSSRDRRTSSLIRNPKGVASSSPGSGHRGRAVRTSCDRAMIAGGSSRCPHPVCMTTGAPCLRSQKRKSLARWNLENSNPAA